MYRNRLAELVEGATEGSVKRTHKDWALCEGQTARTADLPPDVYGSRGDGVTDTYKGVVNGA